MLNVRGTESATIISKTKNFSENENLKQINSRHPF